MRIESAANPRYRSLVALIESAHERRKLGRSVLEGHKLIRSFLDRTGDGSDGGCLQALFVAESVLQRPAVDDLLRRSPVTPLVLEQSLFKRTSRQPSPDGTLAVIDTPAPALPEALTGDVLYLDRLQDPGNMGTILRTCAAAGIDRVVTAPGTVFCWSPKVLRAGMGAHFALTIYEGVPADRLWQVVDPRCDVWATTIDSGRQPTSLFDADLRSPCVWLFGAEGQGLQEALLGARVSPLTIPQRPHVESMNVAAAVAVCLFEQRRQRLCGS
ncbi:MAG: RNA methyltransferase [Burkholderiaceae bacterium]